MNSSSTGKTVSLQISLESRKPMKKIESATFVVGSGLEGDRHTTSNTRRQDNQVLLMDEETLNELGLEHGIIKENVTSSGIDVASLKAGQLVALGDEAVLRISRVCDPCSRMEEVRPGLRAELKGKRGMLASVDNGGTVRVGDPIRLL